MSKRLIYTLLTLITFIAGYFFMRFIYTNSKTTDFANEVILIILGTIVTMVITAALLNKQSEIELEKEQRVKIFDIKSALYFELIDFIEKIILKQDVSSQDLINLEFLSHKLSIIANKEVLKEYAEFVSIFKLISTDKTISKLESSELSKQLSLLCGKIRYDIITQEKHEDIKVQSLLKK